MVMNHDEQQHYQVETFSSICVQATQEAECWTRNEVSEEKNVSLTYRNV